MAAVPDSATAATHSAGDWFTIGKGSVGWCLSSVHTRANTIEQQKQRESLTSAAERGSGTSRRLRSRVDSRCDGVGWGTHVGKNRSLQRCVNDAWNQNVTVRQDGGTDGGEDRGHFGWTGWNVPVTSVWRLRNHGIWQRVGSITTSMMTRIAAHFEFTRHDCYIIEYGSDRPNVWWHELVTATSNLASRFSCFTDNTIRGLMVIHGGHGGIAGKVHRSRLRSSIDISVGDLPVVAI